jgi:hypothetical protein
VYHSNKVELVAGIIKSGTGISGYQWNAIEFSCNNTARFGTIIPDRIVSGTIKFYFEFDNSVKSDSVYLLFGNYGSRCNTNYNGYVLYIRKTYRYF